MLSTPNPRHNVEASRDFKGSSVDEDVNVVVKMDCARELVAAAKELKWLPDKSLENKWPHNTVHERWGGTLKSVQRACLLQSGFPALVWN